MTEIEYREHLDQVDWEQMKLRCAEDAFDNGRTPTQLRHSFENSYAACVACEDGHVIGTARVLSDGVCNAYLVDVWTYGPYRRRGVAREMIRRLLTRLEGQHVYLQTDDLAEFYQRLGFVERPIGMEKVVGRWLQNGTGKEPDE